MEMKVKCDNEWIMYMCRYIKDGYCIREEIELEFQLQSPSSSEHWMVCSNADIITNGMPEWEKYKNNRTEQYTKGDK